MFLRVDLIFVNLSKKKIIIYSKLYFEIGKHSIDR
jgi:hypothetical protein